jgi:ribosomal protein L29
MTERETTSINGDKRFEKAKAGQPLPKPGHFLDEADRMTPEEIRDIRNHNRSEQARLERVAASNADEIVTITELRECSYSELAARADRLKVDYSNRTSKDELVRLLVAATRKTK